MRLVPRVGARQRRGWTVRGGPLVTAAVRCSLPQVCPKVMQPARGHGDGNQAAVNCLLDAAAGRVWPRG